jgi:hypothetical protein
MSLLKSVGSAAAPAIGEAMTPKKLEEEKGDADMGQRYGFSMNPTGGQKPQQVQPGQDPLANTQSSTTTPFPTPDIYGREQRYFSPSYTKLTPEQAKSIYGYAEGGTAQSDPQPVEQPSPMPQYTNAGKQPPATLSADPPALQAFKQMQAQRAAPQAPQTPQYNPAMGGAIFANGPNPTTVEGLYGTYLDRAPDKGGLDFWNKHFGSDIDAGEAALFRSSAAPEIAGKLLPVPTTVEGLYGTYLGRTSDKGGLEHWNKIFGPTVDADEAALFRRSALPELAANKKLAESTGGGLAHEYEQYLRQTVGSPNQLQAPTAPPPTTTNLADSGFAFDPITQRYSEIKGTAPTTESTEAVAPTFSYTGAPYSNVDPKTGKWTNYDRYGQKMNANGGLMDAYAGGGMSNLGDYSDGGRLLRGPGDGVSDSIPAMIGKKQPARLADGEFVVPARIVSELGNGSTEAGARKLYAMMDRIQKARGKTVGKNKVAKNSRSEKYLPA